MFVHREPHDLALPDLEDDVLVLDAAQPAFEMHLSVHRLPHHDLRDAASESPVVPPVPQWTLEARRGNLQCVGRLDRVLHVQDRAEVLADPLAILDADRVLRTVHQHLAPLVEARRPVDEHSQHQPDRLATQLHVEHLEAGRAGHPFSGGANAGELSIVRHLCARESRRASDPPRPLGDAPRSRARGLATSPFGGPKTQRVGTNSPLGHLPGTSDLTV